MRLIVSVTGYVLRRRLTCSCASERASEALTDATSSSEILSASRAAARCARFLDLRFVDPVGRNRHVGHDRHAVGGHFHEPFADGEVSVLTVAGDDHLARHELRDQAKVMRVDAHLARRSPAA